ncbi:MAG: polysaccharide lyase family 1 protein [Limisphaerales bacterium]
MVRMACFCRVTLAVGLVVMAAASSLRADTSVEWKGGDGNWDEAAKWGGRLPWRTVEARINGTRAEPSDVTVMSSDVLVNHLGIADGGNSQASLVLDGRTLAVTAGMDVGKYDGSEGKLTIKGGKLFINTIFVSGGGGPGMKGRGTVEVQDGSIVSKLIELGQSSGSSCTLRMVGSKASGVMVEDGLQIGVYNYLSLESNPPPSTTELDFELDPEGVTPIFTWGKTEGRICFPVPDGKGNGVGTCRLRIGLLDAPPSGDILLVDSANPCKGAFTGLAEGAQVRAEFGGKAYVWTLTYRGGAKKRDIMVTDARVADADGKMIPYMTGKPAKAFHFDPAIVQSSYREFYRQWDAQSPPLGNGTLAFPGAEGYGAFTKGGRGGRIFVVTNLNDSGPGSLREAVEAKGPRTVVFNVGGIIETTGLDVREPCLTIAGQTAPGDGICIKKGAGNANAFNISRTHDVIIRYLRFRAGKNTGEVRCESFRISDSENVIVDHCSASWGNPETFSAAGAVDRCTVQWCIFSEGNNAQDHAFSTIIAGDRSTWHHNLFAHMLSRVPRWGDITVECDFRNNVIYDWGHTCGYGDMRSLDYVNNYLRSGRSTTQSPPYFIIDPKVVLPASLYLHGNVMVGRPDVCQDNWKGVKTDRVWQSPTPFPAPPVRTQTAEAAFELVLEHAGATLPKRDAVDARAVGDARHGTGRIIDSEEEVGAWPAYASGQPLVCTANDGIPDEWKKSHGLPLNDPNVANAVNADGYTTLEVYVNSLANP